MAANRGEHPPFTLLTKRVKRANRRNRTTLRVAMPVEGRLGDHHLSCERAEPAPKLPLGVGSQLELGRVANALEISD